MTRSLRGNTPSLVPKGIGPCESESHADFHLKGHK